MKKNDYKPCNRIKCPYYYSSICPHRKECEHSKDLVWVQSRKSTRRKQ